MIEISTVNPKQFIAADKLRHYKAPHFNKARINYKRSTGGLSIKCQSERLMNKGARTLYCEKHLILITTEGTEHVGIDEQLFDFSYALELKNFPDSAVVRSKFAELYKAEQDKEKKQIFLS